MKLIKVFVRTTKVAKIEVACNDDCIDALIAEIVGASRTGYSGDGIVFVTDVHSAVKIRSGEEDSRALAG